MSIARDEKAIGWLLWNVLIYVVLLVIVGAIGRGLSHWFDLGWLPDLPTRKDIIPATEGFLAGQFIWRLWRRWRRAHPRTGKE